jgi:3-(3-hydroxy-phenyl)propionate hydroxylase
MRLNDPTGQIFPQPKLSDDHLLDQRIGSGFALIANENFIASIDTHVKRAWQNWDVQILAVEGPEMQAWFNSQAVSAVILRPDRYILGVAENPAQLEAISQVFLNFSRTPHEAH